MLNNILEAVCSTNNLIFNNFVFYVMSIMPGNIIAAIYWVFTMIQVLLSCISFNDLTVAA